MMNNVRVHCNGNLDIILNYYTVDVALSFRKFVLFLNQLMKQALYIS